MSKTFTYNLTILEHHLDTFGHVNNAVYLELYEQARWQFIHDGGWGMKEVQERQIGPVILELNLKFKKELKLRDEITIVSTTTEIERDMFMTIHQEMKIGDVVHSEIDLKFGLFDMQKRRLIKPTPEWLKAIGAD